MPCINYSDDLQPFLLVSFPTGRSSGSSLLCDEKGICQENPVTGQAGNESHGKHEKGTLASNHQEFLKKLGGLFWPKGVAHLLHWMPRKGLDSALTVKHYYFLALHRHLV